METGNPTEKPMPKISRNAVQNAGLKPTLQSVINMLMKNDVVTDMMTPNT